MGKADYTDIIPDVIQTYKECGDVLTTARSLHLGTKTVTTLLLQNGIELHSNRASRSYNKRRQDQVVGDDKCRTCRSYSPVSQREGYCLRHHRSVFGFKEEPCHRS